MKGLLIRAQQATGIAAFYVKRFTGGKSRLLLHLDWNLGDEVMAIPLFPALRKKYPGSCIGVQTRYPDLFAHNPYVDAINPDDVHVLDRVLDIRGENRPSGRLEHWSQLLGVVVEDAQPRIYFSEEEKEIVRSNRLKNRDRVVVAISTWTAWKSKRWSERQFRDLAQRLTTALPALRFVELGQSCAWLGMGENMIDRTTVRQAAVFLAGCDLFIGNDSGLMHLAGAVGTPTIGLFGPIDPPSLVGGNKMIHPVWSPVECKGCWTKRVMQVPDQCPLGKPICMEAITPEEVNTLAMKILGHNE